MKKIIPVFTIFILFIASLGLSPAQESGNARKGKFLFRKNCRTCHVAGGSAKELGPNSKTQAQWDEVFKNIDKLKCRDQWVTLSDKDKLDMYAQLWGHAFDSPSPEKCE
ncbi:MAG: c-type cytochrome [Thermodesulfobacteriota bacterium]